MASFTLIEKGSSKYGDASKVQPLYIAPLVAFTSVVPKITAKHKNALQAAAAVQLPVSWDIRKNGTVKNGQKGIHPLVLNQGKCGSCWAHAIAGVSSDLLALNHGVAETVSVTSVMINTGENDEDVGSNVAPSIWPRSFQGNPVNMGCGGGDPRMGVVSLAGGGLPLVFDSCNDYTWYDVTCNGTSMPVSANASTSKFNQAAASFLTGSPDGSIPTSNYGTQACYYKGKHSIITIDPNSLLYQRGMEGLLDGRIRNMKHFNSGTYSPAQKAIMNHLHTKGSVIGCYAVLSDFIAGKPGNLQQSTHQYKSPQLQANPHMSWKKLANGEYVYIENNNTASYAGNHAVVIVGYNVSTLNGVKIPYWIVRNSWSERWNDDGYFNIAMFPVNVFSQFSYEWQNYDQSLLPNGALETPPGAGTSGIYVTFELKDVEAKTDLPVLPGWGDTKKGKNPPLKNCPNDNSLIGNKSQWIAYHQSDNVKSFENPNSGSKKPVPAGGSSSDGQIQEFLSKNWMYFLTGFAIFIVAIILFTR